MKEAGLRPPKIAIRVKSWATGTAFLRKAVLVFNDKAAGTSGFMSEDKNRLPRSSAETSPDAVTITTEESRLIVQMLGVPVGSGFILSFPRPARFPRTKPDGGGQFNNTRCEEDGHKFAV